MTLREMMIHDLGSVEEAVADLLDPMDWRDQIIALLGVSRKLFQRYEYCQYAIAVLGLLLCDYLDGVDADLIEKARRAFENLCDIAQAVKRAEGGQGSA